MTYRKDALSFAGVVFSHYQNEWNSMMTNQNANARYTSLSIALHWLTLLLMVAIYVAIELHESLPRGHALRRPMEDWHIYLGVCLLPIAIFRGVMILRSSIPPIQPAPPAWQIGVTKAMKVYLYVLMIGAPIIGWIMVNAEGNPVMLFGLTLPTLVSASEGLADFMSEVHELLGVSGYFFIGIHAFAGLYHHYLVKDNTLVRMLPKFGRKD